MSTAAATAYPVVPALPRSAPRRGYGLLGRVGRLWLRMAGWQVRGEFPDLPRCVVAVAPHSSNWDFVHGVAVVFALGLRVSFIGKDALFRWPLGRFMRWLGGMPVDRSRSNGLVEEWAEAFARREALWLVIAPEGTRREGAPFKAGFYRIALAAGVPVLPIALNYRERTVILLPPIAPQPLIESGVARVRELIVARGARRV